LHTYSRSDAQKRLVELMGPVAPSVYTMPQLSIPYTVINGRSVYDDADLVAYAEAKLATGVRRMGGRTRQSLTATGD
jgi:hypothetical protein